jgi:hypothetical protein
MSDRSPLSVRHLKYYIDLGPTFQGHKRLASHSELRGGALLAQLIVLWPSAQRQEPLQTWRRLSRLSLPIPLAFLHDSVFPWQPCDPELEVSVAKFAPLMYCLFTFAPVRMMPTFAFTSIEWRLLRSCMTGRWVVRELLGSSQGVQAVVRSATVKRMEMSLTVSFRPTLWARLRRQLREVPRERSHASPLTPTDCSRRCSL